MSYYWFNRKEILLKVKERHSKVKSKNQYKNLSKEEKDKIKEYQRKRYQQLIRYKKRSIAK